MSGWQVEEDHMSKECDAVVVDEVEDPQVTAGGDARQSCAGRRGQSWLGTQGTIGTYCPIGWKRSHCDRGPLESPHPQTSTKCMWGRCK